MPWPLRLAHWTEALLARHWWQPQPTALARLLQPLAALHGALLRRHQAKHQHQHQHQARHPAPAPTPVPVVVVGNVVVGGAGKTPVVIALVQGLRAAGWRPGVISRGYGRRNENGNPAVREVQPGSTAEEVGDEPLLIYRRTGVPVAVARDRAAAAHHLCQRHPELDLIIADDGLQHLGLARAAEVLVFDDRGVGNGLLLPAGPLRQPLPALVLPHMRVLTSSACPAPLQPALQVHRQLGPAWPLAAWWQGDRQQQQPLQALRGRRLLALAGLASPEKFFSMLEAAGLQIDRLPQPDHAAYPQPPWPAGTADVVTTEKDAVKLPPEWAESTRVWVVGLDLALPAEWVDDLSRHLRHCIASAPGAATPALPLPLPPHP